eukprot:TRINITY_DN31487_c0_g1_i1.p1 TRINITY_DN31487_c0_g1~~TRINITY_DN31487_c0_g1_i1.p1  ORF type:complete len:410 (+),score=76.79 TRINITY_DN31487_c0_g1_i1:25-1230(+)
MLTRIARRSITTALQSTEVVRDGTRAKVQWKDGTTREYDGTWLRLACRSCLHETSQRLISAADLELPVRLNKIGVDGEMVSIVFENGHKTVLTKKFLEDHSPSNTSKPSSEKSNPNGPNRISWESIENNNEEGVWNLVKHVSEDGLVIVTNTPNTEGAVANITNKIGRTMETLYETIFDVVSMPDPINIAYTGERLAFHQDLPYYESPPGIQALHCREFSSCVEGGESTFLDAHAVAELLREKSPHDFEVLCRVPASFQKDHLNRDRPARFFYKRPHINLNHRGEITAVFWSPPFEGPLNVNIDDVAAYHKAYKKLNDLVEDPEIAKEFGYKFRLQEGEAVVFNNRRLLHGRESFKLNGGGRHLQGCYVTIDDFNNRLHALAPKFAGTGYVFNKTGNADYH